jgi:hypothetical protein
MGLGQPLGEALDWTPARRPERTELRGSHVFLGRNRDTAWLAPGNFDSDGKQKRSLRDLREAR